VTPVTIDEQMVWALALQTRRDDVVVVGVATPMAVTAALLAREVLHPGLTIIAAATVDPILHDVSQPMMHPDRLDDLGVGTLAQTEILDQIQRGRVTLQFVSPAQVDGMGRLNTSRVHRPDGSVRRLPGGLATADIAVLIGRLIAYRAAHSPRFLPAEVAFTTGAGHDSGPGWRAQRRLPGAGVVAAVTDQAVLQWTDTRDAVRLASVHADATAEAAVAGCGFALDVPDAVPVTEAPPPEALDLLRRVIDPLGIRRLEVRATRADALAAMKQQRS
jgi:acyl CoA:acetate/3-ketoacid CoA transferase beta subunit